MEITTQPGEINSSKSNIIAFVENTKYIYAVINCFKVQIVFFFFCFLIVFETFTLFNWCLGG